MFLFVFLGFVSTPHRALTISPSPLPELASWPISNQQQTLQEIRAALTRGLVVAFVQHNGDAFAQLFSLALQLGVPNLAPLIAFVTGQHRIAQHQPPNAAAQLQQPPAQPRVGAQVPHRTINHAKEFFVTLLVGGAGLAVIKHIWSVSLSNFVKEGQATGATFIDTLHSYALKIFDHNKINADLANAIEKNDLEAVNKNAFWYKANVNAEFAEQLTPLHLAVMANNTAIVTALLEKGAHVNKRTISGVTPLHLAAQQSSAEMVELLLQHGAHKDMQADHKLTPMHLAAATNNIKTIKRLIKFGANVNARDTNNETPLDYAQQAENFDIANLLINYGGAKGSGMYESRRS
jgi:hypothetical protein